MEKSADGVWNLVIPYPGPGIHVYSLIVDGLTIADPGSETFYSNGVKSHLEVPSPGEDFYDLKAVPHGHVVQHVFFSKTTQAWRRMFIYVPPGYDASTRACSTATAKTNRSGRTRAGRSSSSITCWRRRRLSR